jgi:glycosyltransferase involved in cell wall biosynthesis
MVYEPRRILLEMASLDRPGHDRGLGRYTRALTSAYASLGVGVTPYGRAGASKRSRELRAVPLHATAPNHLPAIKSRPWICTILDTIPLDLRDYTKLGLKTRAAYANAKRADRIIALSMHTAERVSDLLSIPWQKIRVLPLSVSHSFDAQTEPSCSKSKYVSSLVDLRTPDPRKRSHWLEPVARRAKERGMELRVAGRGLSALRDIAPSAIPVEAQSDFDLAQFLRGSRAFFYPSAYEGQGLPPLEAMCMGIPVIAFANTSITEMVGPGGYLLDDPVPWRAQQLARDLPVDCMERIMRLMDELGDSGRWRVASQRAKCRADKFSADLFPARLAKAIEGIV